MCTNVCQAKSNAKAKVKLCEIVGGSVTERERENSNKQMEYKIIRM